MPIVSTLAALRSFRRRSLKLPNRLGLGGVRQPLQIDVCILYPRAVAWPRGAQHWAALSGSDDSVAVSVTELRKSCCVRHRLHHVTRICRAAWCEMRQSVHASSKHAKHRLQRGSRSTSRLRSATTQYLLSVVKPAMSAPMSLCRTLLARLAKASV